MNAPHTKYFIDRKDWRTWLAANFQSKTELWLEYPLKKTGKQRIAYNDAVEEALCFGWIDSTVKSLNETTTIQRFCRRKNATYSQANKERLKWLMEQGLIHTTLESEIRTIVAEKYIFPSDILDKLKADSKVWTYYQQFSDPYKRIRIAFIDSARKRPEEFEKRLTNFMNKTRENKLIKGFGGIDKYY